MKPFPFQTTHIPFEASSLIAIMGEPWSNIAALLRQQKLLAPQSLRERLLQLERPASVIAAAQSLNFSGGMLTADMLDAMVNLADDAPSTLPTTTLPQSVEPVAPDLARTVAPLEAPQPVDLMLRNNLPDWNVDDFSMHASDASSDISVHYDITGNSITDSSSRIQTSRGSIRKSPDFSRKVPATKVTKTKPLPSGW